MDIENSQIKIINTICSRSIFEHEFYHIYIEMMTTTTTAKQTIYRNRLLFLAEASALP